MSMRARWGAAAGLTLATVAVLLLFFRAPLLGGGVYYPGDIARQYLPQRAALLRAAEAGELPWWAPEVGAGYPLLAEGEMGALYPFTWLAAAFADPARGITVSILLHYLLSGGGLYVLARRLGRSRPAAWLGAFIWALGGFNLAHLSHLPILSAAAWLPWMMAASDGLLAATGGNRVPAAAASDGLVAATGGDRVPAAAASDGLLAATGGDRVPAAAASDGLLAATGGDRVPAAAASDGLLAATGGDRVPAAAASDALLAASGGDRVPAAAASDALLAASGRRRRAAWAAALTLAAALQLLAGHAQMILLAWVPTLGYALWRGWPARGEGEAAGRARPWGLALRRWAAWGGALALAALLAAPQLLPLMELSLLSQRAGGLEGAFFTSYSFHPLLLATYLSPFVRGNPYPEGSVELMGYVGLLPLALAGAALWRRARVRRGRGRRPEAFWLALAAAGVFLALGRWNPLYAALQYVPLFNLFRVPARYLYWVALALALLAAGGADLLAAETAAHTGRAGRALAAVLGAVLLGVAVAALLLELDTLLAAWLWLPVLWAALVAAWLWGRRRMSRRFWLAGAIALAVVDLLAYSAVLDGTYNATWPAEQVEAAPASLAVLRQDGGLYRIYTKEEILPDLAVMRESLYPSMALEYGVQAANLYMPLVPRNYGDYLAGLTAERLNRLNVKYYLIPQLLPVDAASELYDVENPFAALPAGEWLAIAPTAVSTLTIESYLSHAADLPDGTPAGQLELRDAEGQVVAVPLRVGLDTAEWAYDRDDVCESIAHSRPEIATTFAARSGFPARDHEGHTYRMVATLDEPLTATAVRWLPALPEAFVRVERVRLADGAGGEQPLAHLLGLGDHTLIYRSEDVVIYRNEDALPRAFTVAAADVTGDGAAVTLPAGLTAAEVGAARVAEYASTRVAVTCDVAADGYLVLADLDYPGWQATVDGAPAEILTCDGVFRAVALAPGRHSVVFSYRPAWGLSGTR